jgi:hypothetical protein
MRRLLGLLALCVGLAGMGYGFGEAVLRTMNLLQRSADRPMQIGQANEKRQAQGVALKTGIGIVGLPFAVVGALVLLTSPRKKDRDAEIPRRRDL